MSLIKTVWKCSFSPRLFKIYEVSSLGRTVDKSYEPANIERWTDKIITSFTAIWSISIFAIPLVANFMYQRSNGLTDVYSLSKIVAGAGVIFIASFAARGCSRANNPVYLKFLKVLHDACAQYNSETKQELHKYDFDFWAWPVDFKVSDITGNQITDKLTLRKLANSSGRLRRQGGKDYVFALPCKLVSYIVAHTFAIKIIYPGGMSVINWALSATLLTRRMEMVKQGAERFKLVTIDNNQLDCVLFDRRNKSLNGNVLVISCEGNCGYYESGIISTPLGKGYSVLGWNHPGFGCSTGAPYPLQEENAIDCVMQFAINHLKFSEDQIIVYGWSIGGYTATWAAMNYPSIQSLVLDATFDDVLPLAIMTMPSSLEGLVRTTIREHFNLNIAEQLNRYNGPVMLVRRTEDEIVCTPSNTLSGNRGNMLLTKVLMRRYPWLFSESSQCAALLARFLGADAHARRSLLDSVQVSEKDCLALVAKDIEESNGVVYPSNLGRNLDEVVQQQLLLFLATMYMKDQPSSHCAPLVANLFQPGWDPTSVTIVK